MLLSHSQTQATAGEREKQHPTADQPTPKTSSWEEGEGEGTNRKGHSFPENKPGRFLRTFLEGVRAYIQESSHQIHAKTFQLKSTISIYLKEARA